jgi:hypothetical protein
VKGPALRNRLALFHRFPLPDRAVLTHRMRRERRMVHQRRCAGERRTDMAVARKALGSPENVA